MTNLSESHAQEMTSVLQDLAAVIERLRDEVETLRQAVDDFREEVAYELRKLRDELGQSPPPYRLMSMPRDPLADDFPQRVNAVDAAELDGPAETADSFLQQLMAGPPSGHLAAEDWIEDQEFPPGAIVELEASIFDWFAEYPVTVLQRENWFVADDGLGSFFLLWRRDEGCFLRLLTDHEQQSFTRLTTISPDVEPAQAVEPPQPATAENPVPPPQQQTLW